MNLWTNKNHRTVLDDAEDFAYSPSGGRLQQYLAGLGLALLLLVYGIHCLLVGHATVLGRQGSVEVYGNAALAMAAAYMALGLFTHFHFFRGASRGSADSRKWAKWSLSSSSSPAPSMD